MKCLIIVTANKTKKTIKTHLKTSATIPVKTKNASTAATNINIEKKNAHVIGSGLI